MSDEFKRELNGTWFLVPRLLTEGRIAMTDKPVREGITIKELVLEPGLYMIPLPSVPKCDECGGDVHLSLHVTPDSGSAYKCEAHLPDCSNLYKY
jgi:hypothetical protein